MKAVLSYLRINDENGQLSITNVAVLVVLIKLAIAPQASLMDCGALLVSLASYAGKKVINIQSAKPVDTTVLEQSLAQSNEAIEALKSKVNTLSMNAGLRTKI